MSLFHARAESREPVMKVPTKYFALGACVRRLLRRMVPADDRCRHCLGDGANPTTGVLISCLLLALSMANDETDAVDKFKAKRVWTGEALKIPSHRRWVSYFSQRHTPLRGMHDPVCLSRVEFSPKALVDPRNYVLRTINQSPVLFKAKVGYKSRLCPLPLAPLSSSRHSAG